jgi:hypothetical protein
VLFHDIHGPTAAALPELLVLLKAKGFKVVHLRSKAPVRTLTEYQPLKGSGTSGPREDIAASRCNRPNVVTSDMVTPRGRARIAVCWLPANH